MPSRSIFTHCAWNGICSFMPPRSPPCMFFLVTMAQPMFPLHCEGDVYSTTSCPWSNCHSVDAQQAVHSRVLLK